MPEVHEAVMQMAFVGGRHTLAIDRPANDGEQRVQDGHTQNEQRNEEWRQEKVGLTRGLSLTVGVGTTPDHTRRHRH